MHRLHLRIIALGAVVVLSGALRAGAEEGGPRPFADFTFKRVGLPQAGEKRISIQIAPPAASAPAPAAEPAPTGAPPLASDVALFWKAFDGAPDGRAPMDRALSALDAAGIAAPRLAAMTGIAAAHAPALLTHSVGTGVSPALALAVIAVESSGRDAVVSSAGASGLMQLMPATAARFGVADAFDASENIRGGMTYLGWLLERFGGDPVLALAGYNAGEGAVERAGGVPDYAETRGYVPKVIAAWSVARALCVTPPELVTDGCVFALPG